MWAGSGAASLPSISVEVTFCMRLYETVDVCAGEVTRHRLLNLWLFVFIAMTRIAMQRGYLFFNFENRQNPHERLDYYTLQISDAITSLYSACSYLTGG